MTFHGIKRETAPFVLTPDFVHVMGGRDSPLFAEFVQLCCESYNLVRKHAHGVMNLFAMVIRGKDKTFWESSEKESNQELC